MNNINNLLAHSVAMFKLALYLRNDNVSINPLKCDLLRSFLRNEILVMTDSIFDQFTNHGLHLLLGVAIKKIVVIGSLDKSLESEIQMTHKIIFVESIDACVKYLSLNHKRLNWWFIGDNDTMNSMIWKGLILEVYVSKNYSTDKNSFWRSISKYEFHQLGVFDKQLLLNKGLEFEMISCTKQDNKALRHFLRRNVEEYRLLNAMQEIVSTGHKRSNRTGIDTRSVFGRQFEYVMKERIDPKTKKSSFRLPLLTTKRMFVRGVFAELKWFLNGGTDSKTLENQKVNIWKGNTTREYLDSIGHMDYNEGETGPIYGFQWKHWGADYIQGKHDYTGEGIDQVNRVIKSLQSDPYSRRHIISGWNVSDLNRMCLPPCFISNTMILTDSGYREIQCLTDDDLVFTHRGNWRPILNRQHRTYVGNVYSITRAGSTIAITATEEHPFLVRISNSASLIWVEAKYLNPHNHMLCIPIATDDYSYVYLNGETIHVDQFDWYAIGVELQTGNSKSSSSIIKQFSMHPNDENLLFNYIPEWTQALPRECISKLLNGIAGNQKSYRVENESVALQLQRLYAKIKVFSIVKIEKTSGSVYVIKDETETIALFDDYYMYVPIQNILNESVETTVYNIEVSDDNSYVVENIATHNCHMLYQFMVHEEKKQKYLSLMMTQRSADTFLGVPFNICSLGIFLVIMAHRVGYKPHKIIHSIADMHIYENHIDAASKQIMREPYAFPYLRIDCNPKAKLEDYNFEDIVIEDYYCHGPIKADMAV